MNCKSLFQLVLTKKFEVYDLDKVKAANNCRSRDIQVRDIHMCSLGTFSQQLAVQPAIRAPVCEQGEYSYAKRKRVEKLHLIAAFP